MWRRLPWRKEAEINVHQRPKRDMGIVPVAPKRKRASWEGEKKLKGSGWRFSRGRLISKERR